MISFKPVLDEDLILKASPLVRGVYLLIAWIEKNGPIPLTPSKAFKRVFVDWAAHSFDWPGHRAEELYRVQKVLNEADFFPLCMIHDLMLGLKLGRHYKGAFHLTKRGQALSGKPAAIFAQLVPVYVLDFDHAALSRFENPRRMRGWDVFLNIMNVELHEGATARHLREVFFGPPEPSDYPVFDEELSDLRLQVLRPLIWAGLVQKAEGIKGQRLAEEQFFKTELWAASLTLETDDMVTNRKAH